MVSGVPARSRQSGLALARAWHARDPASRPYPRPSHEASAPTHARSGGISERLRHSFGEQVSPGSSLSIDCPRPRENGELRTSRNTNWRGPVWFPINYLLIESLQQFHHYYGDEFKVECPTRSGTYLTLKEVANELSNRLIKLWLRNEKGERPFLRASAGAFNEATDSNRYWFHEYFNGDNGGGLGASHQTGWTALVAKLIQQQGEFGTLRQPR